MSGEIFHTDDKYILYFRQVTGIVSASMALTLSLGFLQYKSNAVNWLLTVWFVQILGFLFFLAALALILVYPDRRKREPENMQIMFAFIVGLSLFLTNRLSSWGHTESLCLMSALTMGPGSVWAGSMLCKKTEDLDEHVKYAAAAGAGSLVVILPVFLAFFYGQDYQVTWIVVTVLLSLLASLYTYYDIVIFRDRMHFENNDYILSALYVYVDFLQMIWFRLLRPLFCYLKESAQQYETQDDEERARQP